MNTFSSAVRSRHARRGPLRERGFTLIELMITVAIIAILAAIAIPSYQDSVWKAKRAEAKAAMLKALQAEERYYTQNNTYIGYVYTAPPTGAFPGYSADSASNSRYQIAAAAPGVAPLCTDNSLAKCVVITATVIGAADPKCGATLQMDSIGNKTSASGDADCWK